MKSRESYYYVTGQKISKRQWNEFAARWGIQGDVIKDGKTTVAYRLVREMTEAERVINEGRY
jgi:hypothetical protein